MARKTDIRFRRSATQGAIPTTSQLNIGELALNTYDGKLYMKKNVGGSESVIEVGASAGLSSSFTLYEYTASANQTTFSGADSNTNTLAYDTTSSPPKILVYLNGILLDHTTDYTATNGTSVVLVNAAASGDLLQVGAYKSTATVTSITLEDNQKINFGDSNDLSIYHDGSNSIIENDIAGDLFIKQKLDDRDIIFQNDNGSGGLDTYFLLDGSNSKTQFNRHLKIIDNIELQIGTGGSDLVLEHDGTDSYIKNNTGDLIIDCATDLTLDVDGGDIRLKDNGVQFGRLANFLGSLVLTSGASDTAMIIGNSDGSMIMGGHVSLGDSDKLKLGAGPDLEIYHDGSNSYISEIGTGDLIISADNDLTFKDGSGNLMANMNASNSVELYYGNAKKFETTTSGITVTGEVNATGLLKGVGGQINTNTGSNPFYIQRLTNTSEALKIYVTDSSAIFESIQDENSDNYGNFIFAMDDGPSEPYFDIRKGTASSGSKFYVDGSGAVGIGTMSPSGGLHVANSFIRVDNSEGIAAKKVRASYFSTGQDLTLASGSSANIIMDTTKVGIGTNSPTYLLSLQDNNGADLELSNSSTLSDGDYLGRIYGTDSSNTFYTGINMFYHDSNDGEMRFRLKTAGTNTDVMTLVDGSVGIGTTSPSEKLDVAGKIKTGGQIRSGSYLEAFPSFSFVNDTDTGMFRGAADQLEFSTGGTSRMTIDSTGNVAMSQNLTVTGNLTVNGTNTILNTTTLTVDDKIITVADGAADAAAANESGINVDGASATVLYKSGNDRWEFNKEAFTAFGFMIGTTATDVGLMRNSSGVFDFQAQSARQISFSNADNGEHVRIDASGNVGIGTSSPGSILHISDASSPEIRLEDSDATSTFNITTFQNAAGNLNFNTRQDDGTFVSTDYQIVKNAAGANIHKWFIGNSEKLRLDASGRLGIGTTSMTYPLEVHGSTTSSHRVRIVNADNGQSSVDLKTSQQETRLIANSGNAFYVYNQSANYQPFTIKSNHNVGIGVTDPAARLEVKHDSNATNGIIVENTTSGTGARSNVRLISDAAQLDIYATAAGYTGVSSWGDAGVISTSSNASNGLILNSQTGGIKFQDGTAERMRMVDGGQIAINATAARTTGGTSQLTVAGTSVLLNIGSSNNDCLYVRRQTTGEYAFQSYNSGNTGEIQLNPYGGNVGINTDSPASALHIGGAGHLLFERGGEVRSKDTSGNVKTIVRVNGSNELEYGWSGSGPVKFMGGGSYTERMRIHTNGNIGIGTTSPAGKLHISGNSDVSDEDCMLIIDDVDGSAGSRIPAIMFRSNTGGSVTNQGRIRGTGHSGMILSGSSALGNDLVVQSNSVGIGTNSPSANLHVQGNNSAIFRVDAQDGGSAPAMTARIQLYGYEGRGAGIKIRDSVNSASSSSNREWFVGSPYSPASHFAIGYASDGVQSEYSAQNKLTIKPDGNVGINDTNPDRKVSIIGDNTSEGQYPLSLDATNTDYTLEFRRNGTSEWWIKQSGSSFNIHENGVDDHFRINAGGDIGIGTTSPDTKLDITTTGVEGLIINQDTSSSSVSSRLFFKDATRTNLIMNVNGRLEFRTDAAIGSTSGTYRVGVTPTLFDVTTPIKIEEYQIDTTETSTSATTQVAIHSFAAATFRSARFTVQVTNSTDSTYHTTEILMVHDGTTANITEFAEIFTGSAVEAQFDCDINSGNVRLLATPSSTDAMEFKVIAHSITV